MGVASYLGQMRQFKVADITATDTSDTPSVQILENNMKELTLAKTRSEEKVGTISGDDFPIPHFQVFKLTNQTKLTCNKSTKSVKEVSRAASTPCGLSGVGGVSKQKELLRKLVLHPLNQRVHKNGKRFTLNG